MATAVTTNEKVLVFDGDCPMCNATVAMLVRWRLVSREQTRANYDLQGDDLAAVQAAGIRNQLVVLDPNSRQTRVGADGLLWIIGANRGNPLWVRLLSLPGVRQILSLGYEAISYNRRIISPPRHQIVCDCEPQVTIGRRLMLVLPALALGACYVAMFGAAVFFSWRIGSPWQGSLVMQAVVGGGFLAIGVGGAIALRQWQRIDFLSHLAIVYFVGTLLLLPASAVLLMLPPRLAIVVGIIALSASVAWMFALQKRRLEAIGLSTVWRWAWLAAWMVAAAVSTYGYLNWDR